jgi:6-phosphogluconolactonase (cycloisomerase 2 family)
MDGTNVLGRTTMKFPCRRGARIHVLTLALISLAACGGGGSGGPPPTPTYSISATVTGVDPSKSIILKDNGGDDVTVSANGMFTFNTEIASGGTYAVTVSTPNGVTCTVVGGSGTASSDIDNVMVTCVDTFSFGGTVYGLVGQGLTLELVGSSLQGLEISLNGVFAFPTPLPVDNYLVSVKVQPHSPAQQCVVRKTQGVVGANNIVSVGDVVCGEFAYVTDAANGTIAGFSIGATTGALSAVGSPVAGGSSPDAMTGTSDRRFLYVGNSAANSVSAYSVDAATGKLTGLSGSPFAAGTTPRALSLYTAVTRSPSDYLDGPGPAHVHQYLYVANAGSNSVSVYTVDQSTGAATPASPAAYATGTGPSTMAVDLDGPFLFTANTGGSGGLSAFLIDKLTGGLTPMTGSPYSAGNHVSALAFGPGGKFLYAADASGNTAAIQGFSVALSGASGAVLTSLAGFPYPLSACTFIVTDRTGAYLYAANGTSVNGYGIDASSGALSPLPGFPIVVGATADSIAIDPTNQFLYVRNGAAGTVTGFEMNGATGQLTPMPGSPFLVSVSADFLAMF